MGRERPGGEKRTFLFQTGEHGVHPIDVVRPLLQKGTEKALVPGGVKQRLVQDVPAREQPRGVHMTHGVDHRVGGAKNIDLSLIGRIHGEFLTRGKCAQRARRGQHDIASLVSPFLGKARSTPQTTCSPRKGFPSGSMSPASLRASSAFLG